MSDHRSSQPALARRNLRYSNGLGEELGELRGRWVAVRDDHVVADAATLAQLLQDGRVEVTDTRFAVPARATHLRV